MLKYWFKPKFGEFDIALWSIVAASVGRIDWYWIVLFAFVGLIVTAWGHSRVD